MKVTYTTKIGVAPTMQTLPTPFENLEIIRQYLNGHTWTHYEAQLAAGRLEKQIANLLERAGYADCQAQEVSE